MKTSAGGTLGNEFGKAEEALTYPGSFSDVPPKISPVGSSAASPSQAVLHCGCDRCRVRDINVLE